MATDINSYLGVHAQALRLQAKRTELLASNLANADTPGYRARDIDFRAALADAGHPQAAANLDAAVKYRVPLAPSLDGNTVDVQMEQAAFAENAVRYQATLTILNARLRGLLTAITGQ